MLALNQHHERPNRSPEFIAGIPYENVWDVAEACWSEDPGSRIPMPEVFQRLSAESTVLESHGDEHQWYTWDRLPDPTTDSSPTDTPLGGVDISAFIVSIPESPINMDGRFYDLFKGEHSKLGSVALKRPRISGLEEDKVFALVRLLPTIATSTHS